MQAWAVQGGIARTPAGEDAGQGCGSHAIHVLFRRKQSTGGSFVFLARQGAEHQAAMNAVVLVDLPDRIQQFLSLAVRRKKKVANRNADFVAPLHSTSFVRDVVGPLPHPQNRQRRRDPLLFQRLHLPRELFTQRRRHGGAL